jgi:TP901-1 family phage major tail protein
MAGDVGRLTLVKKNAVTLLGLRTATLSWSGESINLTSGEDDGYQLLAEASGEESLSLAIEGIAKDAVVRAIVLGGAARLMTDITIELYDGAVISGDFRISSFEEGSPYNDAVTFSATLESSGEWTYTP